jgi:hypothetical protein
LIILTLILHQTKEFKEGFFNFPDASHNNFVNESKVRFNELTNTINLTDPNIPLSTDTAKQIELAVNVLEA